VEIADKVAVVTGGGGRGSGSAVARRLGREGAEVVVADVDEHGGWETVRQIRDAGGRATFVRTNVASEAEVQALVAGTVERFGGLQIVVNDASAPVPEGSLERWFETIGVDLLGTMYMTLHAIEAMRGRGGGAIVTIGSTSAIRHGSKHSRWPAYDVAKAGVLRLATSLDWLSEEAGVRVNCLVPDWIASPPVKAYFDSLSLEERREQEVPTSLTTPDEIAQAVVRIIRDDDLAGRVMVWWSGQSWRFIPPGDAGYAVLEEDPRDS
jgi:NAD(P)-dependent dehydrogenase (short-subunit alcohol dehydrogenase family)